MSLNTYPYNPFPASTDKLDEAHNAELQQDIDQLKSGLTNLLKSVTKSVTVSDDANKLIDLGLSLPNVVVAVDVAGMICAGVDTYQNGWYAVLANFDMTKVTSGTYTVTIYYI